MNITGGRVYVPSLVTATDTCTDIPVSWDLSSLPIGDQWTLDLESSTGTSLYDSGTGPSVDSDKDAITWCEDDLPGSFTITGTMAVMDEDYNDVSSNVVDLDFSVRKMETRSTLRAGRSHPRVNQSFSLKGCITAGGKRQAYRAFTFEYRRSQASFRRTGSAFYSDGVGCFNVPASVTGTGQRWWRVRVVGDGISKTGYSPSVKVLVHK